MNNPDDFEISAGSLPLDELPDEARQALEALVHKVAHREASKKLDKINSMLDQFADDYRQALTEDDDDGSALSPDEAVGRFAHWLAEESDYPRTNLAILLSLAARRIAEYQNTVLDLEIQLAGHTPS